MSMQRTNVKRASIRAGLVAALAFPALTFPALAFPALGFPALAEAQVPRPADVIGFEPGTDYRLATYDQIHRYRPGSARTDHSTRWATQPSFRFGARVR
jgi:hypothetical protein